MEQSVRRRSSRVSRPSTNRDEPIVIDDTPSPTKSRDHSGPTSGTNTPATSVEDVDVKYIIPKDVKRGGRRSRIDSIDSGSAIEVVIDVPKLNKKEGKVVASPLVAKKEDIKPSRKRKDVLSGSEAASSPRGKRRVKRQQDSDEEDAFIEHLGSSSKPRSARTSLAKGKEVKAEDSFADLKEENLSATDLNSAVAIKEDEEMDELESDFSTKVAKNKGKARAITPPSSGRGRKVITMADYTLESEEDEEDVLDKSRREAIELRRMLDAEHESDDSSFISPLSEVGSDFEVSLPKVRGRGRKRVTRQQVPEEEEESPSSSSESEDDELPLASASTTAPGVSGTQELPQYETAKQRAKRIKRELREARANARALQTGRARKVKTRTQYQKNQEELVNHHPELLNVWRDLKRTPSTAVEKAEQPKGLNIKLLPFQLEGLNWLVKQEQSDWKGGALADEMGMGKTIQVISLLLSDRKKPNLVIAPTVAILQWRNEIDKYTEGFKVVVWHGANRSTDTAALKKADVVLTSYGVLESAFRKQVAGYRRKGQIIKEKSAIHQITWHRVVLDEAHNIKERATNTAKGAFELKSTYRWCLSGTPLQNRVGELYSMIRFLGGDPFSYYYCKRCPCKSLHWQFTDRRHCDKCGHTPMHHVCYWNNEILKPIQKFGSADGEGRDAFERLRLLLDRMMLRRTKLERADDMGLPPRTVEVRYDKFNEEEEDLYESLYSDTTRKFSTYLDQGTVLNNYSNIFTLLTRMRQLACHPDLVLRSKTGVTNKLLGEETGTIHVCRICQDEAEDAIMSKCRHIFCRECVRQWIGDGIVEDGESAPECPYCHATLTIDLEGEALDPPRANQEHGRQGILSRLDMNKWRSSTKIEALLEELNQLKSEDKTIKSLVFSQFVNFLDLIAFRLTRAGFQICRLEGNMSPEARNKTINHFMNNPGVTVFLVSLKAGGVALNLTEASRVYLMDPWWNPSVEVQAMDRIHRLGQHRPIVVKRMIIENSLESRIIELQNKKSAMIEAAIGKDESAMGRLSVSDLSFLFSL